MPPESEFEPSISKFEMIVSKYVQQVGNNRSRYSSREIEEMDIFSRSLVEVKILVEIDELTCECLREIISIEPSLGPAPRPGLSLEKWEQKVPNPAAKTIASEVKQRMREREQVLQEEKRARDAAQGQQLIDKYGDLVSKFLEIAERKVSQLDDYGDERLHLLPKEVDACVVKIAGREGLVEEQVKYKLKAHGAFALPAPLRWVHSRLPQLFAEYHQQQKGRVKTKDEVTLLSGPEFETYVARILQQNGWQVSGTPTTGDQGADLIASKAHRNVVIQAKRYTSSVGNHAVQEVVGAVNFYSGTEGCVVTNSAFTPSARALAQKNNIRLIDGAHLEELNAL